MDLGSMTPRLTKPCDFPLHFGTRQPVLKSPADSEASGFGLSNSDNIHIYHQIVGKIDQMLPSVSLWRASGLYRGGSYHPVPVLLLKRLSLPFLLIKIEVREGRTYLL